MKKYPLALISKYGITKSRNKGDLSMSHIYTAADFTGEGRDEMLDLYSDLYKSLYDIRPHYIPDNESLAYFFNNYDANFELMNSRDAQIAEMESWYDEYTREMDSYYDELAAQDFAEFEYREEEAGVEPDLKIRFNPAVAIRNWEYGLL